MNEIKALLEKCGLSAETAEGVCTAMEGYVEQREAAIKEQYEAEYTARVENAKKICLEETEQYKANLARRVQIFTEARWRAIEEQVGRSVANREGEASAMLEQVANLLHGIPVVDEKGLKAELTKVQTQLKTVSEQYEQLKKSSDRQTDLTTKTLKRNRQLESAQVSLESKLRTAQQQLAAAGVVVSEGRQTGGQQRPTQRIDGGRSNGPAAPRTTRRTIAENQDRTEPRPASTRPQTVTRTLPNPNAGVYSPEDIAAAMDEEVV